MGPVLGGFIAQSSLISWRWTEWISLLMSGLLFISLFLFQLETYKPMLLSRKAKHLRRLTGDVRPVSSLEIRRESFSIRILHALYRPFLTTGLRAHHHALDRLLVGHLYHDFRFLGKL